jgi:hypothetical protein
VVKGVYEVITSYSCTQHQGVSIRSLCSSLLHTVQPCTPPQGLLVLRSLTKGKVDGGELSSLLATRDGPSVEAWRRVLASGVGGNGGSEEV